MTRSQALGARLHRWWSALLNWWECRGRRRDRQMSQQWQRTWEQHERELARTQAWEE